VLLPGCGHVLYRDGEKELLDAVDRHVRKLREI
jgi:hypothetical protein